MSKSKTGFRRKKNYLSPNTAPCSWLKFLLGAQKLYRCFLKVAYFYFPWVSNKPKPKELSSSWSWFTWLFGIYHDCNSTCCRNQGCSKYKLSVLPPPLKKEGNKKWDVLNYFLLCELNQYLPFKHKIDKFQSCRET